MLPAKLRRKYGMNDKFLCELFEITIDGDTFLAIKCPHQETEIEKAQRVLKEAGIIV